MISPIGGGVIQIAALTALIGSSTAESLMLGNKGAAGLAWATMSMFGILSVIKDCVAAATLAWLRETLGVRSRGTDATLGLGFKLDGLATTVRSRAGQAVRIACEFQRVSLLGL